MAALHLDRLRAGLAAAGLSMAALALPPGEATKGWPQFSRTVEWLLAEKVERDDVVVAFGGGVIGDLAGFAAAVLRRGVRFVQIPTTLLAQVDSSVGGKTGINAPQGKNLIGAFHQPALVLADTALLLDTCRAATCWRAMARWSNTGCWATRTSSTGSRSTARRWPGAIRPRCIHAVTRSCQMKAEIVMRDETEQGDRALLNLGHTFCHALEAATGYSDRLLHGEGVAIGCALAFETSARLGLCSQEEPGRVRAHLHAMGMRKDLSDIPGDLPDAGALLALMAQDKKVLDGKLRFVLARGIGAAFLTSEVPRAVVMDVLTQALARRS